jgi:metal-dependent amidase/aminoacylase/carboxypeptidase family protein
LKGIFKDIHRNQELGFMEVRTAGIVAKPTSASASASARPW